MTDFLPPSDYTSEICGRIGAYKSDDQLKRLIPELLNQMNFKSYAYNFTWLGRPIIQIPQDTITFQEMIWEVMPDLIIETGVAHGGSLVFSASMLALLETFGLVKNPVVIGIDIEIRPANRVAINDHPASKWIKLIEGSSVDPYVIEQVRKLSQNKKRVIVFLDSNHTHNHVLAELRAFAPFVTKDSYLVVLDTGIEDIEPTAIAHGRPWGKGNSPQSALQEFLKGKSDFVVDQYYHEKAWVTSAPNGIIKRIN